MQKSADKPINLAKFYWQIFTGNLGLYEWNDKLKGKQKPNCGQMKLLLSLMNQNKEIEK